MRKIVGTLAVAFSIAAVLAGCGTASSQAKPVATAAATKALPVAATLLATCPQVEAVIITLGVVPTAQQLQAAHTQVQALSDAGDLETRNALPSLLASLEGLRAAQPGTEYLDARQSQRTALSDLAGRCKTVGSSALQ
jgi:hypothetical protein